MGSIEIAMFMRKQSCLPAELGAASLKDRKSLLYGLTRSRIMRKNLNIFGKVKSNMRPFIGLSHCSLGRDRVSLLIAIKSINRQRIFIVVKLISKCSIWSKFPRNLGTWWLGRKRKKNKLNRLQLSKSEYIGRVVMIIIKGIYTRFFSNRLNCCPYRRRKLSSFFSRQHLQAEAGPAKLATRTRYWMNTLLTVAKWISCSHILSSNDEGGGGRESASIH